RKRRSAKAGSGVPDATGAGWPEKGPEKGIRRACNSGIAPRVNASRNRMMAALRGLLGGGRAFLVEDFQHALGQVVVLLPEDHRTGRTVEHHVVALLVRHVLD